MLHNIGHLNVEILTLYILKCQADRMNKSLELSDTKFNFKNQMHVYLVLAVNKVKTP